MITSEKQSALGDSGWSDGGKQPEANIFCVYRAEILTFLCCIYSPHPMVSLMFIWKDTLEN